MRLPNHTGRSITVQNTSAIVLRCDTAPFLLWACYSPNPHRYGFTGKCNIDKTYFQIKNTHKGCSFIWRPGSESNRHRRICSPLHNHSATRPEPANLYYAKNICNSTEKCLLYKINLIQRECT